MFKKNLTITALLIMLFFCAIPANADKNCPLTKFNCSCSELESIATTTLNGNPLIIEKSEIENLNISDTCRDELFSEVATATNILQLFPPESSKDKASSFINSAKAKSFRPQKNKTVEDLISENEKFTEHWEQANGIVSLGDKEDNLEGNRWFSDDKSILPNIPYNEIMESLIALAVTPDHRRPETARGFDYNRIVTALNNESATKWSKEKEIQPTKIGNVYYVFTLRFFQNLHAGIISTYEPTNVFGPYGAFIDEFVDVSLMSSLYRTYIETAALYDKLAEKNTEKKAHKKNKEKGDLNRVRAEEKKKAIFSFLWNEELGMFFNYSFHTHDQRTIYPFTASLYPIWAGLFDISNKDEHMMLIRTLDYMANHLEGPNGLYASGIETGLAWDKPNTQPENHIKIIEGIRNYAGRFDTDGRKKESMSLSNIADRISLKYLTAQYRKWTINNGTFDDPIIPAAVTKLYDSLSIDGKKFFEYYCNLAK